MDDEFEFNVNGREVFSPGSTLLSAVRTYFSTRNIPPNTMVTWDGIGYAVERTAKGVVSVRKMSPDDSIKRLKVRPTHSSSESSESPTYYKQKKALADQITSAALAHALSLSDLKKLLKKLHKHSW